MSAPGRQEGSKIHGTNERILIIGAGNLLVPDDGFGIHCIQYLERHYEFPDQVELLDAGTLGILITHRIESASRVYLLDCIDLPGEPPGSILRYHKEDLLLKRLPIRFSPHQIGIQEMLMLAEVRGRCPKEVVLLGAVPDSLKPGTELTPVLRPRVEDIAALLLNDLRGLGIVARRSQGSGIANSFRNL